MNPCPPGSVANVFAETRRVRVGTNKELEQTDCVSAGSFTGRTQKTNDFALGFSLLKRDRLGVGIQRDPTGRVTKEFLRYLDIRSVCSQQ